MATKTIYESLVWHEVRVTAHAAAQYITLKYGEAGARGTRVTLIAGTHGDEGPWSALAIKMLCRHPVAKLTGRLRVMGDLMLAARMPAMFKPPTPPA